MTKEQIRKQLIKQLAQVTCPGCGEVIRAEDDLEGVEYVRTKRKTELFFHTQCMGLIWHPKEQEEMK